MSFKANLTDFLTNGNWPSDTTRYEILRKLSDSVDYAWNYWNEAVLSVYYTENKPQYPTAEFIADYMNNEDFEAAGFQESELEELFR